MHLLTIETPTDWSRVVADTPFDYIGDGPPAINCNPPCAYVTHVDMTTGEIFICVDNTLNANRWIGQLGTVIE